MTTEPVPNQNDGVRGSAGESEKPLNSVMAEPAPPKGEDGQFELVNEEKLTEKVRQIMMAESYSGPTPHPKHLQHYEKVLPGAAKIIFDEFQANAAHQRRIEERQMALRERAVELQGRDNAEEAAKNKRAQLITAGLVVLGLIAALAFGLMHEQWVAGGIVTTLLVTVVTGFLVKGDRSKRGAPPSAEEEEQEEEP